MISTLAQEASLRFDHALPEQATEIAVLVNSAYRGESSRKGWTTEDGLLGGQRADAAMIREMIADPTRQIMWLARGPGAELLGCVHLERFEDHALLSMLTVKPGAQARGLGRELISYAETFVRGEWRSPSLQMTVISLRHELIAYYERRGFRATGETREFPHGDDRYGESKRRDFNLVVLEKSLR